MPTSGIKQWCHTPDQVVSSPQSGDKVVGASEEPLHQKQKDRMPFKKLLKGGQQEAFRKDSDLVQRAREAYFKTNCPDFDCEISCDLSHTFERWLILHAFLNQTSMKFRMHGLGRGIFALPIMLPRLHRKIYSSSIWWLKLNCQASWDWRRFIPQKLFAGWVATCIAHDVPKKGKMRGLWLTTSEQFIIV